MPPVAASQVQDTCPGGEPEGLEDTLELEFGASREMGAVNIEVVLVEGARIPGLRGQFSWR